MEEGKVLVPLHCCGCILVFIPTIKDSPVKVEEAKICCKKVLVKSENTTRFEQRLQMHRPRQTHQTILPLVSKVAVFR